MSSFTLATTVERPYPETVAQVRAALAEVGFGVLTEIDLAATLKDKLGVDLAPQVILGACRPPLAYAAVQADPSIAAVLPCNVVVRSVGDATTVVEAFDPAAMMALAGNAALDEVAADAGRRIGAMLASLDGSAADPTESPVTDTDPRRA
jgi:uncharacterized protein (DUF302 family)